MNNQFNQENDQRSLVQQLHRQIDQTIEEGKSGVFTIKKGKVTTPGALSRFFNSTVGVVAGGGTILVATLTIVNEAFGIVRINSKTPLTLLRQLFTKDKP